MDIIKLATIFILGAVPVYAGYIQYNKYQESDYYEQFRIIIFIFSALAVGVYIYDNSIAKSIGINIYKKYGNGLFFVAGPLFYIVFLHLKRYVINSSIVPGLLFAAFFSFLGFSTLFNSFRELGYLVASLFGFIAFGLFHAVGGVAIAAVNFSLLLSNYINNNTWNPIDIYVIGDILSILNVKNQSIALLIVILSSLLGAFDSLKNIIQNALESN